MIPAILFLCFVLYAYGVYDLIRDGLHWRRFSQRTGYENPRSKARIITLALLWPAWLAVFGAVHLVCAMLGLLSTLIGK